MILITSPIKILFFQRDYKLFLILCSSIYAHELHRGVALWYRHCAEKWRQRFMIFGQSTKTLMKRTYVIMV
jgi:hypothetical protein